MTATETLSRLRKLAEEAAALHHPTPFDAPVRRFTAAFAPSAVLALLAALAVAMRGLEKCDMRLRETNELWAANTLAEIERILSKP